MLFLLFWLNVADYNNACALSISISILSAHFVNYRQKKHRVAVPNGIEKDDQTKSGGGQGLVSKKVSREKPAKASDSKCKQITEPTQQCGQKSSSPSKSTSNEK